MFAVGGFLAYINGSKLPAFPFPAPKQVGSQANQTSNFKVPSKPAMLQDKTKMWVLQTAMSK